MKMYSGMEKHAKVLHVNLSKEDVAGMVGAKYGCTIKPEDVGGVERKRMKSYVQTNQ